MLGPLLRPRRPTPICQPRWKIRKKAARMANIMGNSWSPSVLSLFWPFFPCDWSIKWCVKTESGICVLYSQWWGLVLVKYFVKLISRDFPTTTTNKKDFREIPTLINFEKKKISCCKFTKFKQVLEFSPTKHKYVKEYFRAIVRIVLIF